MSKRNFLQKYVPSITALILVCTFSQGIAIAGPDGAPDLPTRPLPLSADSGAIPGPEFQISTVFTPDYPDRFHPSIAYDHEHFQYLAVWHSTYPDGSRYVRAQLLNNRGVKIGSWFDVPNPYYVTYFTLQPDVVYNPNADEYYVVYMYDTLGNGTKYDIYGQRVSYSGSLVGEPKLVISYPDRSFWSPRVSWNSWWNEYYVTWNAVIEGTTTPVDVGFRLMLANGDLDDGRVISNKGYPTNLDLAYDPVTDRTFFVWNMINASGKNVIRGAQYDGNLNMYDPPGIFGVYGDNDKDSRFPRVAVSPAETDLERFLVIYQYDYSNEDRDIYLAWVSATGSVIASHTSVDATLSDTTNPVAVGAANRPEFLLAYQRETDSGNQEIIGKPLGSGLPYVPFELCSYAFWDCTIPDGTDGYSGFMSVFAEDSADPTVKQHIFGKMLFTRILALPVIIK